MLARPAHALAPAALAVVVLVAGCATGPVPAVDRSAGIAVAPAWSVGAASGEPGSLSTWWQRFGDPALTTLVDQALSANASVAAATASLRQSRALVDVQQARLGPSLGASASAQRNRTAAGTTNTFRAGFDASWEADLLGGQAASRDAAVQDAAASAATLGDVQVSVAAEVAQAYIALRGSEQRLAIAQANLAAQQETLQITQWRVQAGLATSLQSEQARAAVEQTRAQVPLLQTAIAQSRHQLALLTGRPAVGFTVPAGAAVPEAPGDLALAFPADTIRQRPDVRAAEARARAAAQRVRVADAQRWPSVDVGGSLGLAALTLSGLGSGPTLGSLLASVSLPVFDGGARGAQVDAQQAAFDQAREAHRATVLTALKDVEDALVALQGGRERLARLRDAADAAGNASLLARQRYASGLIDFQTVLDTQRTQLAAQEAVAAGLADLATAHVRLYKALGGGWTPQPSPQDQPAADGTLPGPAVLDPAPSRPRS
ncbi:MAG: efflux transporter outer membrane subunit [Ideonella sp.]|jgi:NodT family efflux transporter outer membrane factor (OMF) lipoprotein|nr:efflux transporter outer membrane subunit [Ideonella sp.]